MRFEDFEKLMKVNKEHKNQYGKKREEIKDYAEKLIEELE